MTRTTYTLSKTEKALANLRDDSFLGRVTRVQIIFVKVKLERYKISYLR